MAGLPFSSMVSMFSSSKAMPVSNPQSASMMGESAGKFLRAVMSSCTFGCSMSMRFFM